VWIIGEAKHTIREHSEKCYIFFRSSLSTFPEMRSYPGALRTLVCAIVSNTSLGGKGLIRRDICHATSRKAGIAASV
jgi:hypothetical protein